MNNNLFIRSIKLNKEEITNPNKYPFNIELLKDFKEILKLNMPQPEYGGVKYENGREIGLQYG